MNELLVRLMLRLGMCGKTNWRKPDGSSNCPHSGKFTLLNQKYFFNQSTQLYW